MTVVEGYLKTLKRISFLFFIKGLKSSLWIDWFLSMDINFSTSQFIINTEIVGNICWNILRNLAKNTKSCWQKSLTLISFTLFDINQNWYWKFRDSTVKDKVNCHLVSSRAVLLVHVVHPYSNRCDRCLEETAFHFIG